MPTQGILTGANSSMKFWPTLAANALSCQELGVPLCVADHGLSPGQRNWLKRRGVAFLYEHEKPQLRTTENLQIAPTTAWWKPFACAASPFDETVWIDADAVLLRDPSRLFNDLPWVTGHALSESKRSWYNDLARHMEIQDFPDWVNSGVLGFRRGEPFIDVWCYLTRNILGCPMMMGLCKLRDQTSLALSLTSGRMPRRADDAFNWPANDCISSNSNKRRVYDVPFVHLLHALRADHPNAVVVHWLGPTKLRMTAKSPSVFGPAPKKLVVATSFFNPLGLRNILRNYMRFAANLSNQGVALWTVELAFKSPQVNAQYVLPGGPQHVLWQKESLLNWLIERLPDDFDAIAFIDADLLLLNERWHEQALESLMFRHAVQFAEKVYDLDSNGRVFRSRHTWATGAGQSGRPWGGWIVRRDALDGLFPFNVLGGGDVQTLRHWTGGEYGTKIDSLMTPGVKRSYQHWRKSCYHRVPLSLGVLRGEAVHLYHGMPSNRSYEQRYTILSDHNFDPSIDLATDANGILCWSATAYKMKPKLIRDVANYFASRKEDEA